MSNPLGRPGWVPDEKDFVKAESLAARGLTKTQIADCFGVVYETLNEKTKEYKEFDDAIKRGKAKGIANVTAALLKNVNAGNVTAQIFYLKCQAKWKETNILEHFTPESRLEELY